MGETSPVGVRGAGIPAPLAFLRGVLCLNASYRPVGHCSEAARPTATPSIPTRRAPGPFYQGPQTGGADDVTIGTRRHAW